MRFDKLTTKFQEAIAKAQTYALSKDNPYIEPAHLMLAMLDEDNSTIGSILAKLGVNIIPLKDELMQIINKYPKVSGNGGEVNLSRDLTNLLNLTEQISLKLQDSYIASELFLLACCEDKGDVGKLLSKHKIKLLDVNKSIMELRGGQQVND